MATEINRLLKENEKLTHEKNELYIKLNEAKDIIEGIQKGNIDAVFIANNETANILVSKTADQTYRRVIENMSEGVVTLHSDGTILYSNSSFAKLVNLSLEKVIGTNLRNFIPIEYINNFEPLFKEHPENNSKMDLSILNADGRHTHFIVSLNMLDLPDFEALNLVWTDVTDQKETEEKLVTINENLKKAIEERVYSETKVLLLNSKLEENINILKDINIELATFAHVASHDLQEPLRKIITYSGLLRSNYHDVIDLPGQDYLNIMHGASTRMRNLINDILKYSALSQNDFLFQPTNLQSIVKEIISDFEIVLTETKAKIIIEKELPVIEANSSQMRQLFQNLISNSLKFVKTDTIPEISITYEIITGMEIEQIDNSLLNEKFCKIYIRDNGIGFEPEYIDKVFTIFQRLNNNSIYKGTGIGLAICKKITEKHYGFITAESKLNEGALFTITLPVCQAIRLKHDQKQGTNYTNLKRIT